jgi:hypothetical protein
MGDDCPTGGNLENNEEGRNFAHSHRLSFDPIRVIHPR